MTRYAREISTCRDNEGHIITTVIANDGSVWWCYGAQAERWHPLPPLPKSADNTYNALDHTK